VSNKKNAVVSAAVEGSKRHLKRYVFGTLGLGAAAIISAQLKRRVSSTVTFNSGSHEFSDILRFVTDKVVDPRFSTAFHYSELRVGRNGKQYRTRGIDIGDGIHYGMYRGSPCAIKISSVTTNVEIIVTMVMTRMGSDQSWCGKIFDDAMDYRREREGETGSLFVRINSGSTSRYGSSSSWSERKKMPRRYSDSIFFDTDYVKQIVDHIEEFRKKREWNVSRGLPHHTGIVLYGAPGCGKSSLLAVVAAMVNRNLAIMDLSTVVGPRDLASQISDITSWDEDILVVEDIDARGKSLKRSAHHHVGDDPDNSALLGTLLNILDGVGSPTDMVTIITTNDLSALDPALIRPGRFDLVIEVKPIGLESVIRMAQYFEIDTEGFYIEDFSPMPGATVRGILLDTGLDGIRDYQTKQKEQSDEPHDRA
jgi:hypothetical protein